MKAPKTKIDLVVADTRDPRTQLHNLYLDTATSRLVASNGRILAALSVDVAENDTSGPIPRSALARKQHLFISPSTQSANSIDTLAREHFSKSNTLELEATKTSINLPNGTVLPRPIAGDTFLRSWAEKIPPASPAGPDIVLNAAQLYRLAKALHDENNKVLGVELTFSRDVKGEINYSAAVRVTVGHGPDRVGALMPMRNCGG